MSLIPSAETFPEKVISGPSFDVQTGITPVDNRINDYLGDRYFEGVTVPANNGNNIMTILTIVWTIGILLLVAYTVISYWRLRRKVDTAVRYKDNIFQSENVKSPFVLGIIKPRIYLPFNMNGQDLEHVVAHEQAHIHRKDHWWKPFGFLLLTIHWFNPLVWLAYVLLCRDIELACDEKVIKELGNEQRADYTQALVACSVNRRMIAACPLAFGEVGVKDRVKSVMNYKKPAFWGVVLAVIVCVFVAVCFLTNPVTKNNGTDGTVTEWFDYLETPDEMVWDGRLEINLPEFPGVTFRWYPEKMEAVTEEGIVPLFHGMPIWNTYFCDLTGDRIPDLCSTYTVGSGIIDSRIIIYDYANGASYELSDRGYFDFTLRFNEADGYLYVDKTKYNTDELVETGRLVFKNNSIQIEGFSNEAHQVFRAEILEIHDGHYLVKPVEGSWELNSADRIVVPISNAHPSPEPEIGNVIEIEYSGEILESYPAQIADVYGIKLIREAETWDLIPMVMVNGTLYLDTGHESTIEARCGVMDGEITSQVDGSKQPTVDDQSNFGTGYGYQYGATEGTIELFMNGKWWIFATEEARQAILFPSTENEPSKFYLTIGSEGVKSIKLSMPNSSGGFENADGSLLKKGERIWLENLDGYTDLRGLTITALGENGEIIWTASIPDEEENKGFTHLVNDDWEITNIE